MARKRSMSLAAFAVSLGILGAIVLASTLQLRRSLREQAVANDARILHAVALMQQISGEADHRIGSQIESFVDQFNLALEISRLRGVLGTRLFDGTGSFEMSFPEYVSGDQLDVADLARLRQLEPIGHFHEEGRMSEYLAPGFRLPARESIPLLEVNVPLHRKDGRELLGVVQFVMDGRDLADRFHRLDQRLMLQAGLVFLVGGTLLGLVMWWAYHRLQRANRLLEQRTERLVQANEELSMAAKTSALGAVTAHLLHGLNNPLSGLQDYMANRKPDETQDLEWNAAVRSTRRMLTMVQDAVRVLAEEREGEAYVVPANGLVRELEEWTRPLAERNGVRLTMAPCPSGSLTNRQCNLVRMILKNLLENAIQASPKEAEVRLETFQRQEVIQFRVSDQGPGIPQDRLSRLFKPCRSTKEGGSGIGLAISQHLAQHLGGRLELERSDSSGTVFSLTVPLEASLEHGVPLSSRSA